MCVVVQFLVGSVDEEVQMAGANVDGVAIDEPYLNDGVTMPDMALTTVPEGHVWVMGDNRNRSQDSRRFGAIPVEDVIGRAFVIVWPFDRWGGL